MADIDGFAATEGGVSPETSAPSEGSTGDAELAQGAETPASTPSGGTPSNEPRLIPETDLRRVQSIKDREIAAAQRQAAEYRQAIEALTSAMLQQRWADMPPEEVAVERAQYGALQQQQAVQAERQEVLAQRELMNQQAKPLYAEHLAKTYSVDAEDLLDFDDPDSMEKAAKRLSLAKSRIALQARREAGTDRMDGGGGGSTTPEWDRMSPSDKIAYAYKHGTDRRGKR